MWVVPGAPRRDDGAEPPISLSSERSGCGGVEPRAHRPLRELPEPLPGRVYREYLLHVCDAGPGGDHAGGFGEDPGGRREVRVRKACEEGTSAGRATVHAGRCGKGDPAI